MRKILEHLGLPAGTPDLAPARLPRELSFDFEYDDRGPIDDADAEPTAAAPAARRGGRGPPAWDLGL